MKNIKKLAAVLLALLLMLSMSVTAFAADTGTITVENALVGETYSIYRIFDLESYSGKNYSYKISEKWAAFADASGANAYFDVNEDGYVVWDENKNSETHAAAFAELAMAYAEANSIAADGTANADSTTVSFENLPLGYYLVDTTMGSLCALNTTATDATVNDKHEKPTLLTTVEEDSTGVYGASNDADAGQTVNFNSDITVRKGGEGYVLNVDFGVGNFNYNDDTVAVVVNGSTVDPSNYTVTYNADSFDLTVSFNDDYTNSLAEGTVISVGYSATFTPLMAHTVGLVGPTKVSTTLDYGDAQTTEKSETNTRCWNIEFFKYALGEGAEKEALAGAKFILYKEISGTKHYAVLELNMSYWMQLKEWTTDKASATVLTSPADGKLHFSGLDSDTYYFEEIAAPAGYNMLKDPVKVVVDNAGAITVDDTVVTQVEIENRAGSVLPSTGGIGTTVFYILGAALMLSAVVLLVVKKRMSAAE